MKKSYEVTTICNDPEVSNLSVILNTETEKDAIRIFKVMLNQLGISEYEEIEVQELVFE